MTSAFLFELAWKSATCAGLTLALLRVLRFRSAAEKSMVASLGLSALLILPLAVVGLPKMALQVPAAVTAALPASAPAPRTLGSLREVQAGSSPFNWEQAIAVAYAVPAATMLLILLIGVARMRRVQARAEILTDPLWLAALAAAQQRLCLKHGTALLTSAEINSPISWGFVRPIIIIDRAAAAAPERAEAIVMHELAHVDRLDWPKLMTGRLATAFFWFNPLVWALAKLSHQLCEEAADDAVLRSKIGRADYADLLLNAARHANGPLSLPANAVAPSRSSLSRRVAHILDPARSRVPAGLGWLALSLTGAIGFNAALAAAEPVMRSHMQIGDRIVGERAAAKLDRIDSPHTRALALAIRTEDWSARRVEGSSLFHEPAAIDPLILALADGRPVVRRIGVWGLSEMRPAPGAAADEAVSDLLDDRSPEVRAAAARALGDFGSAKRAASIARLLRDDDPTVRRQAAQALGDLQNPTSRTALEAGLGDLDPAVRSRVEWALRQVAEAERIMVRYGGG